MMFIWTKMLNKMFIWTKMFIWSKMFIWNILFIQGVSKKNALIEYRLKDTKYESELHWKSHFSSKWPSLWHGKYISIFAWVILGRFIGVFLAISWVFKGILRLFQECLDVILVYVMSVSRVLLGCFCPLEFSWVDAMTAIHKSEPF